MFKPVFIQLAAVFASIFGRVAARNAKRDLSQLDNNRPARRRGPKLRKGTKPRRAVIPREFYAHRRHSSGRIYGALASGQSRHGKCSAWLREDRRRRSAGLPPLRSLGPYASDRYAVESDTHRAEVFA